MTAMPLWSPSQQRLRSTTLFRFMEELASREECVFEAYHDLHRFSTTHPDRFWDFVWDFFHVIGEKGDSPFLQGESPVTSRFFPEAQLNYAENLLYPWVKGGALEEGEECRRPALIFHGENGVRNERSFSEVWGNVAQDHHGLKSLGINVGDRVCAVVPNAPETLEFFLATASLGAIWSSCSPDFGVQGILDRFGQIDPAVLVVCDGYLYNGKTFDLSEKINEIAARLPSLKKIICLDFIGSASEMTNPLVVSLRDFRAPHPRDSLAFTPLPFDHPLYILYSSGTTGIPKCIVHRAGGVLLKHLVEHRLHCDLTSSDRLFYFTTCGWMMWNWMVSGLAAQASLVLYDGSPFFPNERRMFEIVSKEQVTIFGTSAKYLESVRKTGLIPKDHYDFSALKALLSTGSPLSEEGFSEVYRTIKNDLHLASISGGTDICGCFVLGNPISPVWAGEIQGPALGLLVDVFDEQGNPLSDGKGELVCRNAFPSMPLRFWNDPLGTKYHSAYFDRFPETWCHGDFSQWTSHGGMIIHGRSDATLNPGGVRIGTAELYAQVDFFPEILESVAIGYEKDHDVQIILFVKMKPGCTLGEDLRQRLKMRLKTQASPRHVPSFILEVPDIPKTKSGKITELAIRDLLHGREVKNQEALANPESLDFYRGILERPLGEGCG